MFPSKISYSNKKKNFKKYFTSCIYQDLSLK